MTLKKIHLALLLIGCIWSGTSLLAQSATLSAEWSAIRKAYETASSLSFEQTYRLYASQEATEPIEKMEGRVRKNATCLYHEIGPIQTIETSTYFFKLDHDQQEMVVLGRQAGQAFGQAIPVNNIDSLIHDIAQVDRVVTGKREVKYTITGIPGGLVSAYEFYFNTETHWISKLVLHYRSANGWIDTDDSDSPRLEITYSGYSTQNEQPCEELDYTQYMTNDHGSWRPVPAYRSYKVTNQLLNAKS